jgi:DNA-binding response OmpR family regulator
MAPIRRRRVLVVDDERTFVELLAGFLEDEGFQVERAYDGEQALRLLRTDDPPHLVLTDVMMPRLSGPDLLAEARLLHTAERLPFVLLSAGLDPGVNGERVTFMAKPLDLLELLAHVETLLPVVRAY